MKPLKDILQKTSSKTQEVQPYNPEATSAASKSFLSKHTVQKTDDANGNDDDVFNASHVKSFDRATHNYGNDAEQSKAVYEDKSCSCDEEKELSPKQKKIASLGGNKKKLDAADFKALRKGAKIDEESIEEAVSRKHFRQVADLLKEIPDEDKRRELAHHHAGIFAKQNPRFDKSKFLSAANVKDKNDVKEETIEEGHFDAKDDAKDIVKKHPKATKVHVKQHLEKINADRDTRSSYGTSPEYMSDVWHEVKKMQKESVDIKSLVTDISNKTKELANIITEEDNIEDWNNVDDFVSSVYDNLMDKIENMKQETRKAIMEKAPPGQKAESFITKNKASFKKRYGDRWEKVLYATAHKIFGKGEGKD